MNREILRTAQARADIFDIARHISRDDPTAAERVTARIFAAGMLVEQGVPGRPGRMAHTFEKAVGHLPYILAHEIERGSGEDAQIVILHVIHGARDWSPDRWPDR